MPKTSKEMMLAIGLYLFVRYSPGSEIAGLRNSWRQDFEISEQNIVSLENERIFMLFHQN